jgi:hypothetical protein
VTAPTPNAELAYRVLDQIDAHPEQWDQTRWWKPADMAPGVSCGTAGCFAGWAVSLSGGQMARGDVTADVRVESGLDEWSGAYVPVAAAALLGLPMDDPWSEDEAEHQELFHENNTREDLGRLVAEIFGPRPVDWNKPLVPVLGTPASGCNCSFDGGVGLSPHPDRERGHAEDCPAFGLPPGPALSYGTGCRCTYLGEGTPEHTPSALCLPGGES